MNPGAHLGVGDGTAPPEGGTAPPEVPRITIVGLGPAGPDLVTVATMAAIDANDVCFLRTRRHPAAEILPDARSFDAIYQRGEDFDEVYSEIVETLVEAAGAHGSVLYAVPGSPLVAERTVEALLADSRVRAEVHPAMSFVDLAWARLGVDPVALGARLVDAHRLAEGEVRLEGPSLVAQCHDREVLSELKLSLDGTAPSHVVVLQGLGTPEERVAEVAWDAMDRDVEPDHLTSVWVPEVGISAGAELDRLSLELALRRWTDPAVAGMDHTSLAVGDMSACGRLERAFSQLGAHAGIQPDVRGAGGGSDAEELLDSFEELGAALGEMTARTVLHATLASEDGVFDLLDVVTRAAEAAERLCAEPGGQH